MLHLRLSKYFQRIANGVHTAKQLVTVHSVKFSRESKRQLPQNPVKRMLVETHIFWDYGWLKYPRAFILM